MALGRRRRGAGRLAAPAAPRPSHPGRLGDPRYVAAPNAAPDAVQTRGRITLPTQLRLTLDVQPGDEVEFVETSPGHYEVKTTPKAALLRKTTRSSRTCLDTSD